MLSILEVYDWVKLENFLLLEEKKTLCRSGIAAAIAYRGTAIRWVKVRCSEFTIYKCTWCRHIYEYVTLRLY
jgi:hypothetical protein